MTGVRVGADAPHVIIVGHGITVDKPFTLAPGIAISPDVPPSVCRLPPMAATNSPVMPPSLRGQFVQAIEIPGGLRMLSLRHDLLVRPAVLASRPSVCLAHRDR